MNEINPHVLEVIRNYPLHISTLLKTKPALEYKGEMYGDTIYIEILDTHPERIAIRVNPEIRVEIDPDTHGYLYYYLFIETGDTPELDNVKVAVFRQYGETELVYSYDEFMELDDKFIFQQIQQNN